MIIFITHFSADEFLRELFKLFENSRENPR